ncbi:unnamed protein product [Heterobilharzia americana]|nr:unnamed protein product [Heterobilharzia americana]
MNQFTSNILNKNTSFTHLDEDVDTGVNSVSSDVEENAEATEQPNQIDKNLDNGNNIDNDGGAGGGGTGADEIDDENEDLIDNILKSGSNSDVYQKNKVGNWLGANGIKTYKNTQDEMPISIENEKVNKVSMRQYNKQLSVMNDQQSKIELDQLSVVNNSFEKKVKNTSFNGIINTYDKNLPMYNEEVLQRNIYYPYAHNISINNLPSSITNKPISSIKYYPKIYNTKLSLSKSIDQLHININDQLINRDNQRYQHISRLSTKGTTTTTTTMLKDLSPQPRDWYYINSTTTTHDNDISNIILDSNDTNLSNLKRNNYSINEQLNKNKHNISNNINIRISNDLLFDNGYSPLNINQMSNKIDVDNDCTTTTTTPIIDSLCSYINLPNSMLAQTTIYRDLIYPPPPPPVSSSDYLSSMGKTTKLLNRNNSFFISQSNLNIQSKLCNKQLNNNQINNYSNNNNNNNLKIQKNKRNNYHNNNNGDKLINRTAGSSAAHLAAMGVGSYKLIDSLALLTTRTDHLIESNQEDIQFNGNSKSQEYQTKTSSYSSKQAPSILSKAPTVVQSEPFSVIKNQYKEDDNDNILNRKSYRREIFNSNGTSFEDNAFQSMIRVTDRVQHFMNLNRINNEISLNELTKNLPSLAEKSNIINQSSSSSNIQSFTSNESDNSQLVAFIQQLIYYCIVGFIVYKILIWFNIRPHFG